MRSKVCSAMSFSCSARLSRAARMPSLRGEARSARHRAAAPSSHPSAGADRAIEADRRRVPGQHATTPCARSPRQRARARSRKIVRPMPLPAMPRLDEDVLDIKTRRRRRRWKKCRTTAAKPTGRAVESRRTAPRRAGGAPNKAHAEIGRGAAAHSCKRLVLRQLAHEAGDQRLVARHGIAQRGRAPLTASGSAGPPRRA